jgi:hypothetical protein
MSESESFVDASKGAAFLGLSRRRLLELARSGVLPGHPIGLERKTWRFRLSELADAVVAKRLAQTLKRDMMSPAVPGNRIGGTR